MATSLIEAASSRFIEARNVMNPSMRPQIWIYVEGEDDISFWNSCITPYKTKFDFKIKVYRIESGLKKDCTVDGKLHLLEVFDLTRLGPNMLLAMDADYDWIIDEYKPSQTKPSYSKLIREHAYILHTYLYSIENYKSHHSAIDDIFVKSTNECPNCEFGNYINRISESVAGLFIIHLLSIDLNDGIYNLSNFRRDLGQLKWDVQTHDLSNNSKRFICDKLECLSRYAEENKVKLQDLENKLSSLGFSRNSYYLLMQGHIVWNALVKEFLHKEIIHQRKIRIADILKHPHPVQRENQIKQYCKLTCIDMRNKTKEVCERIEQLSKDFTSFAQVPEGYSFIQRDLIRLFGVVS